VVEKSVLLKVLSGLVARDRPVILCHYHLLPVSNLVHYVNDKIGRLPE